MGPLIQLSVGKKFRFGTRPFFDATSILYQQKKGVKSFFALKIKLVFSA